jgi:hypothetical protein
MSGAIAVSEFGMALLPFESRMKTDVSRVQG